MQKGFEKRFNQGDIVYWCHHKGNADYSVHYGMVDEQFSDVIVVDYLVPRERRRVDGVPIDEFQSEQRCRKLPKGWTYNTELFKLTWDDFTPEEKDFVLDISKPETLKEAYDKGYLVKDNTIFHGVIEDEITKDGFRIVKKYPRETFHHIDHVRQASLSDYDWSVDQIDKTLDMWKAFNDASDKDVKAYRGWLLGMKDVENIETRLWGKQIQWKYWKNTRWNCIEL